MQMQGGSAGAGRRNAACSRDFAAYGCDTPPSGCVSQMQGGADP
jgi:hypothetical protein